jgi:hypothetical protein
MVGRWRLIRRADLTQRPVPLCAMLSRWRSGCFCFFFRSQVCWSGRGGELAFLPQVVRPNIAARSKNSRPRWVTYGTCVMHCDLCRRIAGVIAKADSRRANGGPTLLPQVLLAKLRGATGQLSLVPGSSPGRGARNIRRIKFLEQRRPPLPAAGYWKRPISSGSVLTLPGGTHPFSWESSLQLLCSWPRRATDDDQRRPSPALTGTALTLMPMVLAQLAVAGKRSKNRQRPNASR